MIYEKSACLYDALMEDAPYDRWLDFFLTQQKKWHPEAKTVLDLACGTGEITIRLQKKGFDVTGVDLSVDMLTVAQHKAMEAGFTIPFYEQDMSRLEGLGPFDIVVIFCDSLNYLETEEQFIATFERVYDVLNENGLLLFDVHSPYKIENGYIGKTFAYNGDDIAYIWNCFPGPYPDSVEHELTFFVYDEGTKQYERYDELHRERTFPVEQYEKWLTDCGFTIRSITGDFTDEGFTDRTERVFFTVQK